MNIYELLNENPGLNITINAGQLLECIDYCVMKTRKEIEAEVIAAKAESYLTRLETCDFLKVDQSTLFRWSRRGYLMPVEIGGRRLYRMSDLTAILKGKGHNND